MHKIVFYRLVIKARNSRNRIPIVLLEFSRLLKKVSYLLNQAESILAKDIFKLPQKAKRELYVLRYTLAFPILFSTFIISIVLKDTLQPFEELRYSPFYQLMIVE